MEVRANCPFCNDTRKRFYYNTEKNVFFCFNCNKKGTKWSKNIKVALKRGEKVNRATGVTIERPVKLPFVPITKYAPGKIKEYILKRATWEQIAKYRFCYLPKQKLYKNRVILPTINKKGEIIYFQARSIRNDSIKYLNPSKKDCSTGKSNIIWNLQRVPKKSPNVVITEGIFDGISIPDGYIGVCLFGKHCSQKQIEKLKEKLISRVFIALDPDAREQQENLASQLDIFNIKSYLVNLKKDPADTPPDVISHYLRTAKEYQDSLQKIL